MAVKTRYKNQFVGISEGRAISLGKARNRRVTWGDFIKELARPVRTNEKLRAFFKLPKEEQDKLKAVPGWILGAAVEQGRRRRSGIKERSLITLDCDEITPEILEEVQLGLSPICRFEFVAHTTRKHRPDSPRLRIYLLPTADFDSEKYDAVSRILAEMIEPSMDMVDDVSFRSAQMMFKPSVSSDSEYLHWVNPGEAVDVDEVLADFRADWRDYRNLPYSEKRGQRRKTQDKAENPLEKRGIVGAFCRAYDVEQAMAEFIPDVYVPGDDSGAKPRYTYSEGTASNGVVVEDDGLFIYSHHGSDPCGETLCNAFDMVRIHRFEHLDEKKKEGANPKDWPSYKAMAELVADDEAVKSELLADRVDIDAMFDDISDPDEEEDARSDDGNVDAYIADLLAPSRKIQGLPNLSKYDRLPKPKKNWHLKDLELDSQGRIKPTMPNIATIILNDPRLHRAIGRNDLAGKVCVRRTIQSRIDLVTTIPVEDQLNGEDWEDLHDHSLRAMLESAAGENKPGWGMDATDRNLRAAVILVAQKNRYHPVVEYFDSLRWDGQERVERLWIDHMGTPDTPYYRETARLFMLAVVCRCFNPGNKWDHAPILKGDQGIRKSSFIKALFGQKWAGELTADMASNKDAVEQMLGKVCLELPELATMRRGEVEDVKEFMTLTEDRVRLSYDRRMSTFKRQAVFMGTTNAEEYLKDPTGNRRFWPIVVRVPFIDTDRVEAERDQLWAEAYALWRAEAKKWGYAHIPLTLSADAREEARLQQNLAQEEDSTEIMAELIRDWVETPIPLSTFLEHDTDLNALEDLESMEAEPTVIPTVITPVMAAVRGLKDDYRAVTSNKIRMAQVGGAMRRMTEWRRTGGKRAIPGLGRGHAYERIDITREERERGYRIVGRAGETPDTDIL